MRRPALLMALIAGVANAQFDWDPRVSTLPPRKKHPPIDREVPHLRCGVCERLVGEAHAVLTGKRKKRKGANPKVPAPSVDGLCIADGPSGRWLTALDVVQVDATHLGIEQRKPGHCKRECRTLEVACTQVMDALEDELADTVRGKLAAGQELADITDLVCGREGASVCGKGAKVPPPLPAERTDEEHRAKTKEVLKIDEARWQAEIETPGQTAMSLKEYFEGFEDRLSEQEFKELTDGILKDGNFDEIMGEDKKGTSPMEKKAAAEQEAAKRMNAARELHTGEGGESEVSHPKQHADADTNDKAKSKRRKKSTGSSKAKSRAESGKEEI